MMKLYLLTGPFILFAVASIAFTFTTGAANRDVYITIIRILAISAVIGISFMLYKFTKLLEQLKIDAEKTVQAKEHETHELMQKILDSAPFIINLWDDNFNIMSTNPQAPELHDLESQEQYIKEFFNLSPEYQTDGMLSSEKAVTYLKQAYEEGKVEFEWMHIRRDGNLIPTKITIVRETHKNKTILIAYTTDLTLVKETEERLQAINNATPIGVNFLNTSFQVIDSNEMAYKNIFGFPGKEEYMQNMHLTLPEFQPDGTNTLEKITSDLAIVLEEGVYRSEWMVQSAKGESLPLDVSAVRLTDKNNEITIATFLQDLRPFRDADAKMREAEMELQRQRLKFMQESNMAKTRFLARMSHEIRTPITAVMGVSEIQLRKKSVPTHIEEAFATIHDSANTLLGIVNDILDFSKIESGNMELLDKEYMVASLVSDATQLRLVYLEHKSIIFSLSVDENLPTSLIGDELRIRQIMNNLLSNAFKYTEQGLVSLSLRYDPSDKEGHATLVITIKDTGLGMTPQQLETLKSHGNEYKRFHVQEDISAGGTGLGVSIVLSLIQMMEATIDIQSEKGVGTCVTVRIPQKTTGAKPLGKETAQSLQNFELGTWSTKKVGFVPEPMPYGNVLVVDDVEANLYVAQGLLAFYELDVDVVDSGQAAIDAVKEKIKNGKAYDLILLDQTMPGLSGTETMLSLRDMGYSAPIVALTANAIVGQAKEFIKSGFDDFVSKPVHSEHLHRVLIKFIKDKQHPKTLEAALQGKYGKSMSAQGDAQDFQNDPDIVSTLRSMFVKTQMNAISEMQQAIDSGDMKTAHLMAHTLKSSAGLIGESALVKSAENVESLLLKGEAPESLAKLQKELDRVLEVPEPSFDGQNVLVVEDSVMNMTVAHGHLKQVGLTCTLAKNGIEAVDIVKKRLDDGMEPFDLIFMDIYMPEMDGLEAATIISGMNTGTPIIAMTAAVLSPEDRASYKDCGMEGYIGKPFTSQALWRLLVEYLETGGQ